MVRHVVLALITACSLFISGCGGDTAPPVTVTPTPTPTPTPVGIPYPAGLSEAKITVNRVERQFLVHVPSGLTSAKALIVVLHGGGGSATQAANSVSSTQTVFRTVADREGLVAVYPNAIDLNWNDCRGDTPGISKSVEDVAFLDALLTRLGSELNLNSSRMFMTGNSNGAMMSMRYALERSNRIAAIAVSSGNLAAVPVAGRCTTGPERPVPILMTHGDTDTVVPYNGGCVAGLILPGCPQGTVIGAEATLDRWLAYNGLTGVTPQQAQTNVVSNDGGPAVQSRYSGASPVEWWKLVGAGHTPPSQTVFVGTTLVGVQNRDVEFAEIAWTFFAARLP